MAAAVDHLRRPAGPGRLVEGRAAHQRHDGRRGPAAAAVPRHPATPTSSRQAARWIRSQQRADGTWATFDGGPGDLSTTIEAYAALRLAGDAADAAAHARGRASSCSADGGIEASRVFTRIWLALFGEWSWDELPAMPPELVLLPSWVPLNVYDWACWARQTVVPITVVATLRPVRPLPFDADRAAHRRAPAPSRRRGRIVAGGFDRARPGAEGLRPLAGAARAARPAHAPGRRVDPRPAGGRRRLGRHPAAVGVLDPRAAPARLPARPPGAGGGDRGPRRVPRPRGRRPTARCAGSRPASRRCGTPAWPSSRCSTPASPADDPAVRPGRRLAARRGDHASAATGRCAGPTSRPAAGRSSSPTTATPTSTTPPRSCSRCAASATRPTAASTPRSTAASPGWSACSRATAAGAPSTPTTPATLVEKLPFCDFGAVIDPPSADVTAHVVEMLAARRAGRRRAGAARRRTGCSTRRSPTARGSAAGAPTTSTAPARWCRRWSRPASTARLAADPARRRAGWTSTRTTTAAGARTCAPTTTRPGSAAARRPPSQTAWALLALLAAGDRAPRRSSAGVALAGRDPARRRRLGRGPLHRHRLPGRLLHQLRDVPAASSRSARSGRYVERGAERVDRARPGCVVVTALRTEYAGAARTGRRRCRVVRVRHGAGPGRAHGCRGSADVDPAAVVVAGVAGGLDPDAARRRRRRGQRGPRRAPDGTVAARRRAAGRRAARPGCAVHTGPIVSTDHIVDRPAERARLAATGALAVDMESAPIVARRWRARPSRSRWCGSSSTPPTAPLWPPGHGAPAASRALRDAAPASAPALRRWADAGRAARRSCWPRRARSAPASSGRSTSSSGRCSATRARSTSAARSCTTRTSSPTCSAAARCSSTSSTRCPTAPRVVFSAHGVAPAVRAEEAARRGLTVIDATCPLVAKVHTEARRFAAPRRHGAVHRPRRPRRDRGHARRGARHDHAGADDADDASASQVDGPGAGRLPDADHAGRRRGRARSSTSLRERVPG